MCEVMASSGSDEGRIPNPDLAVQEEAAPTSRELISRLARRHDVQLSTLTRYAEALGLSLDFVPTNERAPAQVRRPGEDLDAEDFGAPQEDQLVPKRAADDSEEALPVGPVAG